MWKAVAATALAVAGLSGLGYAGWALTARRAMFVDIHAMTEQAGTAGPADVSAAAARSSDAVDAGWWWATVVLLAVALLLWLWPRLRGRLRLGPLGFTGACTVGAGLVVVAIGCYVASLTGGQPERADQAAIGVSVVGAGFLLLSLGLLGAAVSLFRPHAGQRILFLGYAGWTSG